MWSWQLNKLNWAKYGSIAISVIVHFAIVFCISRAGSYKLCEEIITLVPTGGRGVPVRFGATKTQHARPSVSANGTTAHAMTRQVAQNVPMPTVQKTPVAQAKAPKRENTKKNPVITPQAPVFSPFKREPSRTEAPRVLKTTSQPAKNTKPAQLVAAPVAKKLETQEKPLFSEFKRERSADKLPEKAVAQVQPKIPTEPRLEKVEKVEKVEKLETPIIKTGETQELKPDLIQQEYTAQGEYSLSIGLSGGLAGLTDSGQSGGWQQDIVNQIQQYIALPPGFEEYAGIRLVVEVGHLDGKAKTIEEPQGAQRAVFQAYKSCILKVKFPRQVHGKRIILIIN